MRIALLGAPGAGKSSLAAQVFVALREEGVAIELVSEFAREYIAETGGIGSAAEQVFLAREQRRREETLAKAKGVVVLSDSPFLINHCYAGLLASRHGRRQLGKSSLMLEVLYKEYLQALADYDLVFFVERARSGAHADGIRIHTASESKNVERLMLAFLDIHGGPDHLIQGDWDYPKRASFITQKIREAL